MAGVVRLLSRAERVSPRGSQWQLAAGAGAATTTVAAVVVLVVVAVAVDGGGSGYRRLWLNVPQISRSSWLLLLIYGYWYG